MEKLKYLFRVTYLDGSTYHQNPEDRSVTEPDKRSCFFDVKQDEVATFTLEGDGKRYLVDLRDGHFESDGEITYPDEQGAELGPRRLIFYRQHTHSTSAEGNGHTVVYFMGWQATDTKGKNQQHIIALP